VSHLLFQAEVKGLDPVEELARKGWLLTPEIFLKIQVHALQKLFDELEFMAPWQLLVRQNKDTGAATPTDMYQAILTFVAEYQDYVREDK